MTILGYSWLTVTAFHAFLMPLNLCSWVIPALSSLTLCAQGTYHCMQANKREKKQQESRSSDLLPGDTNSLINTLSFGIKEVTEVRIAVQRNEKVYIKKKRTV